MWPQRLLNYCEAAGPSHAIFNQFFDVIVVLASFRLIFYLSIEIREKIYNFEHVYSVSCKTTLILSCGGGAEAYPPTSKNISAEIRQIFAQMLIFYTSANLTTEC